MKKITQNLKWLVTLLTMIVSMGAWGQEVTYDFTGDEWSVSNGVLTNGTVNITGSGNTNFKMNSGYFILGKSGAYITLPTYDFPVSKIEVVGNSIASSSVTQNIFVGNVAVSTQTTGAKGTNIYVINSNYQDAGTQYTLKVTNANNTQITAIKIYNANAPTITISDKSLANKDIYLGTEPGKLTATVVENGVTVTNPSITWTSSDVSVATVNTNGHVTLVAVGTTTITATYKGYSATYELTVISSEPQPQTTEFTVLLNNDFFGTNYSGSASGITDENPESGTVNNVTIVYAGSGNHYINDSQTRFYPNNKLTFTAPEGYVFTEIKFTESGTWNCTFNSETGTITGNSVWTGSSNEVVFTGSGSSRSDMTTVAITLTKLLPAITLNTYTIDAPFTKVSGKIEVTYTSFEPAQSLTRLQFYEVDGETPVAAPDWIGSAVNTDRNIEYSIDANTGDARTAYFKVYCRDNAGNELYSELVTVSQAAVPVPYTLGVTPNDNAEIFVFYNNEDYTVIESGDEVLEGSEVLVSVSAKEGYVVESVSVTDGNGNNISLTDEEEGIAWTFVMPASDVTVSCTVEEILKFAKVTSTDDLFIGGEYIIVNEEYTKAMSTTQNNNNRGAAEIILDNGTATIGEDTQIFTLEGGSDGWYFNTGSGYIYAASSSNNQLKTGTEKNNNAKATITISNGSTSIVFNRSNGRNTLQYNPNTNNNNPLFTCYASASQEPVQLYKKVGQNPITIDENTTLAVGKYATRIYPFAPKAIEGITFYSCKAVNGNALALTPVTELKANTPYILGNDGEGATEAISIKQTGVDKHEEDTYTEGYLTGVFAETTVPEGSYVLQTLNGKQAFYKVEGEFTINTPYRAYLTVPTDVAGNVKAFNLGVDDATAINTLEVLTSGAYEGIYTVDGVKLNHMEKGVNILKMTDGTTRKVIVK